MNEIRRSISRWVLWPGVVAACLALAVLVTHPYYQPSAHIRIRVNDQGVAWLGPIPLRNQQFRDWFLTAVHRVYPQMPFELAPSEKAPAGNVTAVLSSLLSAGVPLCTMVTWAKPPVQPAQHSAP